MSGPIITEKDVSAKYYATLTGWTTDGAPIIKKMHNLYAATHEHMTNFQFSDWVPTMMATFNIVVLRIPYHSCLTFI